ncbi:Gfo/Idh/MocA family protein [Falsibacillus pallidus]|uniref:Putative dehydrogenase n=1 Tax=Falsibacillus pallidus TaxID=493781 RepID=A0A370GEU8_9BACI|nr:Gfo/Idh/MocA family oxidoreductase [Falsibacillus pallidus]RDI42332.1 putative dehydrogenase [Falsibacillus pallidus]
MLNFGTIGTSSITTKFIDASKKGNNLKLTSVYSRDEGKAKEFADKFGAEYIFTDLEEMAKSSLIDAIYIASPNSMHYEQAKLFLKNKKHVICEKPIFSNSAELEEIFQVAEENGVFILEAIRNIHSPNFKKLKENISKAGAVRSANLHYVKYSSRYDLFLEGEVPNIFNPSFSGGALVDLGVYPIFLAAGLFGEPKEIFYYPVLLSNGIDGSGTLVLVYEGFVCTILCSKIAQSYAPNEIHGENGTFILDYAAPITSIEFIEHHFMNKENLTVDQNENDMVYEIEEITGIIENNNQVKYAELKDLSRLVLKITETARKKSGIVFDADQK